MHCKILLLQPKPKLGCTKPLTGPHCDLQLWVEHRLFRIRPMCLAIAGLTNQTETKSHICYSVAAKNHIMYIIHGHT